MWVDLSAAFVFVVAAYVATVVRSVGKHAHATLDAIEKKVAPEQPHGPIQLRPSRWGRANR